MESHKHLLLNDALFDESPFPHFLCDKVLTEIDCAELWRWLIQTDQWYLSTTDFYQQNEFDFLKAEVPNHLQYLYCPETIQKVEKTFRHFFGDGSFQLVGLNAHKLTNGHKIGIHNDFINGEETHRLVIHLNPEWKEENGGYLMMFNSSHTEDIAKIIEPINNRAFAFEISPSSHHAVSKIYDYSRLTLVYTFRKTGSV